jgi:2-polyprenyl-6-methoxyphenol hydroxylase-like FAD-dependent oxidoreductase
MPAVGTALVVGGGAAGAATAILLAEAGVAVDLVEAQPEVSALGSGITLQGNALRVASPRGPRAVRGAGV